MTPAAASPSAAQHDAAHWHLRLAQAHMTEEEFREFQIWVEADPAHLQAMETALRIDRLFDHLSEDSAIIGLRAEALKAMGDAGRARHRPWRMGFRWIASAAVMLLAVLATTMMMRASPVEHYGTGTGERRVVMLADGSRLSLDAATDVDVAFDDDRRVLTLRRGRAKIDVVKNPLRPFSVSMADRTIVAIGTSFSVELLQRTARVALYQGMVDIIARSDRSPAGEYHLASGGYTLKPGYELVMPIGGDTGRLSRIDADALSWEQGRLTFINEPLPSAVERMNRYSLKKIDLGGGDFASYRVNGVFDAGDTAAFVEGVTAVLPLSVEQRGGKMLLKARDGHSRR